MIRNAKVLGLALVAMLAMSAVAASAASATAFDATSTPVKITASQEAENEHIFSVTFGNVVCKTATFSGEQTTSPASEIAVLANYEGCLFAGITAKVEMNGCEYVLKATGKVDLACPLNKEVTVVAPAAPATAKCIVHVPPQTGLGTATYTAAGTANSQTEEITLDIGITGIRYSQTEGSGLGKCPTADNETTGTYTGKALATGENLAGTAHVGIIWTA